METNSPKRFGHSFYPTIFAHLQLPGSGPRGIRCLRAPGETFHVSVMVDDLPPWPPSKRWNGAGWVVKRPGWHGETMRFWKIRFVWVMLCHVCFFYVFFLMSYTLTLTLVKPAVFQLTSNISLTKFEHFWHSSLNSGGGGTSWWRILGHQDAINTARAERNGSCLVNRGTSSSQGTSIWQSCGHLTGGF